MGIRSRSPVTGAQFALAIDATVRTLTPPGIATGAAVAEIFVRTAPLVFTRDGTDPTATKGIQANVGDIILLNSRAEIDAWKGIEATATDSAVDVEYFSDVSG